MADRVKGIVIELGADTTPLSRALSGINASLKSTQGELNDVSRLLKLDPTHTELLTQKQQLLEKQTASTAQKLDTLKTAQTQLQKKLEDGVTATEEERQQMDRLQREIVATEESFKKMEAELKSTQKTLEDNAESAQTLSGKMKKLGADVTDADSQLGGKLTKSVEAFGVAAAAAGTMALKSFAEFSGQVIKVRTLLDETVLSFEDAKASILEWSAQSAAGADEVAEAMYNALSAGVQTADIQLFMAQATQTAVAGFTDAATAVDVLTTILNSYGMSAEKVTEVSDKLLLTQEKGKVTVGQLASGLGNLVGVAASAGVSLDEVLAAVSALTAAGQAPSSAINSLKAAISNMIKPSGEAAEMARQLHIRFDAQALAGKGLSGMLEELARKTGGSTEKMAKLFGSVEALNAMLILAGEGNRVFDETLTGMNSTAGKTAETFDLIASDPGFRLNQSLQEMKNALIEVGDVLAPLLSVVAHILDIIASINPTVLIIIGTLLTTAAMVIQLAKSIAELSKLSGPVGKFFGGMDTSMIKTASIIMTVVAALIALAAIIAVIVGKGNDLRSTMNSVSGSIAGVQSSVSQAGNVPRYASGTSFHRGGWALTGENGPELALLPQGTRVLTASQTREQLSGGDTFYVTIDAKNVREFNDIVRMAHEARQQRRAK